MAKLWRYSINPIFPFVWVILHFWVTLLYPSSKSSFLKRFLFLLIPVNLQTLSMDKLPIQSCIISFLGKVISCLAFTLGVPHPLSTSSDTVHLEAWLYLEICGSGEAVIRSLTYYVIEEQRVKEAGKKFSIRVNKKVDTTILFTVLSVMFNAESISQRCENIISAVISVISNSFQRICCLPRKVTNYIL